jgi:lipopolysaccharide/colanic/teichoic acid biosynthesis glycosyltransferase
MFGYLWCGVDKHVMTGERPIVADELTTAQLVRPQLRKRDASPRLARRRRNGILRHLDGDGPKRLFDIVFSMAILTLCAPLYLAIALLLLLTTEGPIFFVQERVGQYGRRFQCIKFRTMIPNAAEALKVLLAKSPELHQEFHETFKLKQDPRVTWLGRFLRVTSLDEFPQFWNVLIGDMSVVGPRPLVEEELPRYGDAIDTVLMAKPGITGLWQVSGRNDIPYDRRVQMDAWYSKCRTFRLDLWIVIRTIGVVVFPKNNGAY